VKEITQEESKMKKGKESATSAEEKGDNCQKNHLSLSWP